MTILEDEKRSEPGMKRSQRGGQDLRLFKPQSRQTNVRFSLDSIGGKLCVCFECKD